MTRDRTPGEPEILDPELSPADGGAGAPGSLLEVVARAFPGATVREDGHRIEVEGSRATLRIVRTPLIAMALFRGMRIPVPPDPAAALPLLHSIGHGDRVVVEERGAGTLRRSHLVLLSRGKMRKLEDTTNDREEVPRGVMRVASFTDGVRDATGDEQRFIKDAMGGTLGRFRRKVMEKILDKTLGAVVEAVQGKVDEARMPGPIEGDAGSRTLPRSDR